MATSGSYALRYTVDDIMTEAFALAGVGTDQYGSAEIQGAIRSMNMILSEWAGLGENNFQIERQTIPTVALQRDYVLAAGTSDVLDAMLIKAGTTTETPITRVNRDIYVAQPDKTQQGDPIQFWLDRQPYVTTMRLLNTPRVSGDTIAYWRLRQIQDIITMTEDIDAPNRWNSAIMFALGVRLYAKRPDYDQVRMARLEKWADKAWKNATASETDRTPLNISIDLGVN